MAPTHLRRLSDGTTVAELPGKLIAAEGNGIFIKQMVQLIHNAIAHRG